MVRKKRKRKADDSMVTEETYGAIKNSTDQQPTTEEIGKTLYKLGIIDKQGNIMPQYVGLFKKFKNTSNDIEK